MNMITNRPSAKIFEFPRSRTADGRRANAQATLALRPELVATVETGSGWYHAEAIEETRRGRPS